jgi:hypothetical protein
MRMARVRISLTNKPASLRAIPGCYFSFTFDGEWSFHDGADYTPRGGDFLGQVRPLPNRSRQRICYHPGVEKGPFKCFAIRILTTAAGAGGVMFLGLAWLKP